jgi:DNA repair protein RadC
MQTYPPTKLTLLSLRERPTARVADDPAACTSLELLAAAIGGRKQFETAEAILAYFGGDIHRLFQANVADLESIPGIGKATAARLKALLLLAKRLPSLTVERASITHRSDVAALCDDMSALDHEVLRVFALDAKSQMIATVDLYKGTVNAITAIRPAEIMRFAIQRNATAVVIAHNHPSGDPTPSPDDVAVTRVLVQAGKTMDIEVLDHVVVGHGKTVSLKERGLGF